MPGTMTQFRWDAGLIIAIPQGDLSDVANTSIGLRAAVGYTVNPNLSAHASFRYILVSSDIDGVDFSYRDLGVGGRYTLNSSGNITPYAEGELLYTTFSASFGGESDSNSDPGILGRAGASSGDLRRLAGQLGSGPAPGAGDRLAWDLDESDEAVGD